MTSQQPQVLYTRTRMRPPAALTPAVGGSQTITLTPPLQESSGKEEENQSQPDDHVEGTLHLRGAHASTRRVQWDEEVVDNEHMNKKKSKICCIYHKPRAFDESDSDKSDSSEYEDDNDGAKSNDDPNFMHGKGCKHRRQARDLSPNAYERQPGHRRHHNQHSRTNDKGKESSR